MTSKKWIETLCEAQRKRLIDALRTCEASDVAERFGISREHARQLRLDLGIARPPGPISQAEADRILRAVPEAESPWSFRRTRGRGAAR